MTNINANKQTDPTNKDFWQRMAPLYAPFMKSSAKIYEQIGTHCGHYLKPDYSVLELACGSGQVTEQLAPLVSHWEATDYADKMIEEAKKRVQGTNLAFCVCDATQLPYPDASFDTVLIANALHVMPQADQALKEIERVLKPGGFLMAPTFVWGIAVRQKIGEWLLALVGFRVYHVWTGKQLADYIQTKGFSLITHPLLGGSIRPLCCLVAQKRQG